MIGMGTRWVAEDGNALWRIGRRSAKAVAYASAGLVLAVAGFVAVSVLLIVGVVLSITPLGLWILAWGLATAGWLAEQRSQLASGLLGVPAHPPAHGRPRGVLEWRRNTLTDGRLWRLAGLALLQLPLAILTFVVGVAPWVYGVLLVSYPIVQGSNDAAALAAPVFGVALLAIGPTASRLAPLLEQRAGHAVRRPSGMSLRLQELEETRSIAVADASSTLRRIERDLHDGAQAQLVSLGMSIALARQSLGTGDPDDVNPKVDLATARALLDDSHAQVKSVLVELRRLAQGIHPPILDSGLDAALSTLAATAPVPVDLRVRLPGRPSVAIETIAYFCCAELLTNALKHSAASRIGIEVTASAGRLTLVVSDDGRGGADPAAGSGLPGLISRIRTVDGSLDIVSPIGGPTIVRVDLPLAG
jgi:signal transduction histidine kinase